MYKVEVHIPCKDTSTLQISTTPDLYPTINAAEQAAERLADTNSTDDHDLVRIPVKNGWEWWVVDGKDFRNGVAEPFYKAIVRPASKEEMKAQGSEVDKVGGQDGERETPDNASG